MKQRHHGRQAARARRDAPARHNWKAIFLIAGVSLFLLAGAAGFRTFLTSRTHDVIGGPYALVDGHGRPVSQADFQGRYTLIYFGYTHCADVCPLTLATVSTALDGLEGKGQMITPLFISVDPGRDTPQIVQDYVAAFSPRIVGLTGTERQIRPVMDAFHVTAREHAGSDADYLIDHSSVLYLMDGQNHLAGMIPVDSSAPRITLELERMLSKS